jgi:PAS domain S-box-containing protein
MLETELFALLEQTADAAYTVTEGGEICSWNGAVERLFGYADDRGVVRWVARKQRRDCQRM